MSLSLPLPDFVEHVSFRPAPRLSRDGIRDAERFDVVGPIHLEGVAGKISQVLRHGTPHHRAAMSDSPSHPCRGARDFPATAGFAILAGVDPGGPQGF